jgi:D-sedoheptulose 7-phosphate isomerase
MIDMTKLYYEQVKEHLELVKSLDGLAQCMFDAVNICSDALVNGGKIMLCGNGGSAADSQHIAAEFVGRFTKDRRSLPALALTTDTSALTCIGNDYGFNEIFSRQIEGIGNTGDVLLGISTSGNSKNIISAIEMAHRKGIKTIVFTGIRDTILTESSDISFQVPSDKTARIQEIHILLGHIMCAGIEENLHQLKVI